MYIHIHIIAIFWCKAVACCALSVAASDSPHASFLHWLCCFAWERSWWLDQVCKRPLLYAPQDARCVTVWSDCPSKLFVT